MSNFTNLSEVTRVKILQFLTVHDTLQCRLVSKEFFPRDLTLRVIVGEDDDKVSDKETTAVNVRLNLAQNKDKYRGKEEQSCVYIQKEHGLKKLNDLPDFLLRKTKVLWLMGGTLGAEEVKRLAQNCQRISRMKVWFLNPEASSVLHKLLTANQSALKGICLLKPVKPLHDRKDVDDKWDYSDPIDVRWLAPMTLLTKLTNLNSNMIYAETLPCSLTSLTITFPAPIEFLKWVPSAMINLKSFGLGPIILKSAKDFDLDLFKKICNDMTQLEELFLDLKIKGKEEIDEMWTTVKAICRKCRKTKGIATSASMEGNKDKTKMRAFYINTKIDRVNFKGL